MAKGRELKRRIKTVENTRKITRTMELVATSRMKRAQDRVTAARPYARALGDVIAGLYSPDLADRFPLLRQPERARKAAVILLTSNRGLCGGFNANLIREARGLLRKLRDQGTDIELHVVGRKGIGYFRYVGQHTASLVEGLMTDFVSGALDAVYVVYAQFRSAISTPPKSERLLPVEPPKKTGPLPDYLLFPSAEAILTELLPSYVRNAVYRALVET